MNKDQIYGSCKYLAGCLREQWAMLAGDERGVTAARRQQIAGRMQKMYGVIRRQSAKQLSDWRARMKQAHHAL